jgi:predicted nucleotidyltransferase
MRTLADGRQALRPPPSLDELREQRSRILAIAARHGAGNVRVFGSVAGGRQGDESDLDLLVDFAEGVSLLTWARLIRELEQYLGCAVDVVEAGSLKRRIRPEILTEAVPL